MRPTVKITCLICNQQFDYGNGNYPLKKVPGYGFMACYACYDSNYDGWSDSAEEKILEHLETTENNYIIERLENCRLPQNF